MHHLMIDFETLGTTPDTVVLSLGACLFTPSGIEDEFYLRFNLEEQIKLGRKIDASTLEWWMNQSDLARSVFKEKGNESIDKISPCLSRMLLNIQKKKLKVWCKGLDFDVAIINHIFKSLDQKAPWDFWNVCCFRTFLYMTGIRVNKSKIQHDALGDAKDQAKVLIDYFSRRKSRG